MKVHVFIGITNFFTGFLRQKARSYRFNLTHQKMMIFIKFITDFQRHWFISVELATNAHFQLLRMIQRLNYLQQVIFNEIIGPRFFNRKYFIKQVISTYLNFIISHALLLKSLFYLISIGKLCKGLCTYRLIYLVNLFSIVGCVRPFSMCL